MKFLSKVLAVMILSTGIARADDIITTVGGFNILWPTKQVNIIQCYDFKLGRGFMGAETNLVSKGDAALTFGGVTSTAGDPAFTMFGLHSRLPSTIFDTTNNELTFGFYYGNNFKSDGRVESYGLKLSLGMF